MSVISGCVYTSKAIAEPTQFGPGAILGKSRGPQGAHPRQRLLATFLQKGGGRGFVLHERIYVTFASAALQKISFRAICRVLTLKRAVFQGFYFKDYAVTPRDYVVSNVKERCVIISPQGPVYFCHQTPIS